MLTAKPYLREVNPRGGLDVVVVSLSHHHTIDSPVPGCVITFTYKAAETPKVSAAFILTERS